VDVRTVRTFALGTSFHNGHSELGPVDKPVLAPAQPERLGRCNTDVATG
jgi:hypothetical protein